MYVEKNVSEILSDPIEIPRCALTEHDYRFNVVTDYFTNV